MDDLGVLMNPALWLCITNLVLDEFVLNAIHSGLHCIHPLKSVLLVDPLSVLYLCIVLV